MRIFRDPLMGRRWGLMLPALLLTVLAARLTCADPAPKPKPRELTHMQDDPAVFGWFELTLMLAFPCLPNSAWADERWAEWAEQMGKMSGTAR